ncbi:MAG: ATP-binding protein [Ktedonobacteraceae bacterium]
MDVEQLNAPPVLDTSAVITTILAEWSAITDYRTLRDSLPRRLAHLLGCRCVLLYQRIGETLQFSSGSFDDIPGWSAALLAVAHINPIDLNGALPEAAAWRERRATLKLSENAAPLLVAVPLLYRQRAIGVLVAFRNVEEAQVQRRHPITDTLQQMANVKAAYWTEADLPALEAVANVVALLLENTRLLERDRQRIHELALLNSIANQLHGVGYEPERIYSIVAQRTKEITSVDLCALITATVPTVPTATAPWMPLVLQEMLLDRFSKQGELHSSPLAPLILERPGDAQAIEYFQHLPATIKTFFAIPLVMNASRLHPHNYGVDRTRASDEKGSRGSTQRAKVHGMVVGAYHKAWKLRREELVLLQVLVSQASAALENIHLMAEVVEARNEARKLLRQVLDDVTFMHQLEEEKRRLDRLASLGEMAASVAHEVRNPLASIKTSMQLLKDDLTEDTTGQCAQEDGHSTVNEEAQESVTVVLKEVERLDAIVRDLLLFARPRQLHCVVCNLRELSDHVLKVMQSRCAELGVTIQRAYQDVPSVFVDIAQMEQVLFNLYTNALQAMTDGGVLSVSCQVVYTEKATHLPISHAKEVAIEFGTPIGFYRDQHCWLELAVSDTGVGITAEQLKRIFQPFFTTKAHGIGLGLPITRRLIEDHHGHLLVKSQSGHGATFSMRLPLVE